MEAASLQSEMQPVALFGTSGLVAQGQVSEGAVEAVGDPWSADDKIATRSAGLQDPKLVDTEGANDGRPQEEQTVFVPGIGQLPYRAGPAGTQAAEQTVFVNGSHDRWQSSQTDSGVPSELYGSIERLTTVLNESLRGSVRTEMADLLTGSNSERIWALALPRLRELLGDA